MLLTSIFLVFVISASSINALVITYTEDNSIINNPERGWFRNFQPIYSTNTPVPAFTACQLINTKNTYGVTLVRKYYLLYAWKTSDLPQSFLNEMAGDCAAARAAGVKIIPRYTYNYNCNDFSNADASETWTKRHIDQLKPIWDANVDVLDHLQPGFVGQWGEWHTSTNNHTNASHVLTQSGKNILNYLIQKFPVKRNVAIRYVSHFNQIGLNATLNDATAFNGSNQARSGNHNDMFAYDIYSWSTYDPYFGNVNAERTFMETQSIYTVQSGEPDYFTQYLRDNDLAEFAQFHWSSINMNMNDAVGNGLYDYWHTSGKWDIISKKLGYRFVLTESTIPATAQAGGTLALSFKVKNVGWAAPYNPRGLEIILRNKTTGAITKLVITDGSSVPAVKTDDPRFWKSGTENTISISKTLPSNIAAGNYDVLLNLPDPLLPSNSAYSIRMANVNTWEAITGYNSLLVNVEIKK